MRNKVFVGNLKFETTQEELKELLSAAGQILDIHLPKDRATGRPRGFAFVEFSSASEAEEAISRFHDYELAGRKLRVNTAEDKPRRSPRPFVPDLAQPPRFEEYGNRSSKPKGSRRGLRRKKRSL